MISSFYGQTNFPILSILRETEDAIAEIRGSAAYPNISGMAKFYRTVYGVIVYTEVTGLPDSGGNGIFGYHIHEGTSCRGNETDAFADALTHYNPANAEHPYHAGDLPPLFSNNGFALSVVLTDRFDLREVIGRTLIIHSKPDDFVSQPSGNAGEKIACGIIQVSRE